MLYDDATQRRYLYYMQTLSTSEKLEKLEHLLRSQVVAKAIQDNLGLSPAEIEAITTKLKTLWMARTPEDKASFLAKVDQILRSTSSVP